MNLLFKFIYFGIFFLSFSSLGFVNSINLDINGGYSIVVAVEPSTSEPEEFQKYIDDIRSTLTAFSVKLFMSTNETFFLRKIDLLLPVEWESATEALESTTQSYESSDVRMTRANAPYVENTNPCGQAGNFIELPFGFLESSQGHAYGEPAKALLSPWARYRWGVWEEHGESGSKIFPHFYKNPTTSTWDSTTCSNVELEGQRTDKIGETCGEDPDIFPTEDCRFRPSQPNTPETSLMGFHWVDSIQQFCDDSTHNKFAPNRQNAYCGHQSVWGVIRKTVDFATVTTKLTSPPTPQFNVVIPRMKPALYLLMDRGAFTANSEARLILPIALRSLANFLQNDALKSTVTSVARFPPSENGQVEEFLENLVSWSTIGDALDEILEAIGFVILNPVKGDFAHAIQGAANEIYKLHPAGGAVLLVLKAGSGEGFFESAPHEGQLAVVLKENRISLFAAEIENTQTSPSPDHLKGLANSTGGTFVSLRSTASTAAKMDELLSKALEKLDGSIPRTEERLVYKGKVMHNTDITVPLMEDLNELKIYLILPVNARLQTLSIGGANVRWLPATLGYGEHADPGRRFYYMVNPADMPDLTQPNLVIQYTCSGADCTKGGTLLITGTQTEPEDIVVSIFTSAPNNELDFSAIGSDWAPFVIYAKVEKEGKPVSGLLVKAEITDQSGTVFSVNLLDNGLGSPDTDISDGIYSATYIPTQDGFFTISVLVQASNLLKSIERSSRSVGRLLPEDQEEIEPEDPVELEKSFSAIFEFNGRIKVSNRDSYEESDLPVKIMDLTALALADELQVTFTSPPLMKGDGKASKYIVQGVVDLESFLAEEVSLIENLLEVTAVKEAGQLEILLVQDRKECVYFRIQAEGTNAKIQTSSIAQAVPGIIEPTIEPITSTVEPVDPSTVEPVDPSTVEPVDPSTVEPVDPSTVEPVDPSTVEPIDPSTVEPVDPSTVEPVDPSTVEPVDPSTVEPVDPSTVEPVDPSTVEPIDPSTVEPVDPSTVEPVDPSTVEPIDPSTVEPVDPSTVEPVDPSTVEPVDPSTVEPVDPSTVEPVNPSTVEPVDPSTVEPVEPSTVEPIDPSTVEPVDPSTVEPVDPSTVEPVDPSTVEPVDPSTVEPVDPSTVEPVDPSTVEPVDPSTVEPVDPSTVEPVDPSTVEPVDPSTVEPVDPSTVEPVDPSTTEPPEPSTIEPDVSTIRREETDDKPFFETAGGIVLIVVIVLLAVAAAGGGFIFYKRRTAGGAGFTRVDA